jgi:hypothetical protein
MCISSVLLKYCNYTSLLANAWLRRDGVLRTMNISHDCCCSWAVNSSTSYHLMVAWYIRVKTESVVRGDTFCAIRVIFTLSGKWRARWMVFPLSSHPLFGQRRWPRESTAFVPHAQWPCVWKLRLIDRPSEWPLVKLCRLLYQCELLSILVARLYSAHSVRMSDGRTAKSDCRPLLSSPLENIRWKYGWGKR